jgi:hypothetical protein
VGSDLKLFKIKAYKKSQELLCMFRMASGASHSLPFRLCDLASALYGLARIATVLWVNAIRRHGNVVEVQQQQHPEHVHTHTHPLL